MLNVKNNIIEKKKTLILIFIHKITSKHMQELLFFLQKNNFHINRITRKYKKKIFALNYANSNFILESNCQITRQQLQNLISFLNQHIRINYVFFKNQILTVERIVDEIEKSKLSLWKQMHQIQF